MTEGRSGHSFAIQWLVTDRCNLRCRHCYDEGRHTPDPPLRDLRAAFDAVVRIPERAGQRLQVAITGGEPLLREDLWDIVRYVYSHPACATIYVLTNGLLVTPEWAAEAKARGCHVQVSIDGGTAEVHDAIRGRGTFGRAMNAVRLLVGAGVRTVVQLVVHRLNVHTISDLAALLDGIGLIYLSVTRLVPAGRGRDLADQLLASGEMRAVFESLNALERRHSRIRVLRGRDLWGLIEPRAGASCNLGYTSINIMTDGTVYPCRRLPLDIGNIWRDDVFRIWYGSELLWKLRDRTNLKGRCAACARRDLCGGCRALAYAVTGDPFEEDPQCWLGR